MYILLIICFLELPLTIFYGFLIIPIVILDNYPQYYKTEPIKSVILLVVSRRFLAGARNDMAIRLLWGAEVAIRVTYCLSKQFTFESPLLPTITT